MAEPRLFEFKDGTSDKFWEISLDGDSHTVRYGRVGTDGQSKTKTFHSEEKAEASYNKLIEQKTKKGYQEVADRAESRSTQVVQSKEALKAHKPFLEAIQQNPDDFTPYGVYADWLSEQGDPRGEFIRIQWQLEDENVKAAARKKLQTEEKKLLKMHQNDWLGELGDIFSKYPIKGSENFSKERLKFKYRFARGFLDSIHTTELLPDFADALVKSPCALMLRSLHIDAIISGYELLEDFEEYENKNWDEDGYPSFDILVRGKFPNLRSLVISEGDDANCHMATDGVDKLVKNSPLLETLHLDSHEVNAKRLFKLPMAKLRSLTVNCETEYPFSVLAKNKSLTNLESITCYPHGLEYDDDPYIVEEDIKAIAKSKTLTSLKRLKLTGTHFGDAGIQHLVDSGLIRKLDSLLISYGSVTDEGATMLSEMNDKGLLREVDLSNNYLTKDGIDALKKLKGVKINTKGQLSGDPNDEKEHLWYGDPE